MLISDERVKPSIVRLRWRLVVGEVGASGWSVGMYSTGEASSQHATRPIFVRLHEESGSRRGWNENRQSEGTMVGEGNFSCTMRKWTSRKQDAIWLQLSALESGAAEALPCSSSRPSRGWYCRVTSLFVSYFSCAYNHFFNAYLLAGR